MTRAALSKYAHKVLNTILPSRCIVTGIEMTDNAMISPAAWAALDFIADPHCYKCGMPFTFDVEEKTHCTPCLDAPPPYTSARAALIYNDASRALVLGFKHGDKTHGVKAFTPWMARTGTDMIAAADYLIPVPLHFTRLIARRYNQAALICKELSRVSNTPALLDGLVRTRATPTQGYMSYKDRGANVRGAFAVSPKCTEILRGKTVILVEDVYTTGATVNACTKALLKADVADVHVLTLARVVRAE